MTPATKKITYRNIPVYYRDQGSGPCLILLHGYLESAEIWNPFLPLLTDHFRVICPDIPGHGKSGIWGKEHSMDDLAEAVLKVIDAEGIDRVLLAGHSMGGYVTMAFAENHPGRLSGYVLFHSTCFADNPEKRANRDREISLVLCGKKRQIVHVNIPKAFSDGNVQRFPDLVAEAQRIAFESPDRGVVALLNGMKARPDRSHILSDPSVPCMLIGGRRDNYIPGEVFGKLKELAPHARVLELEESGHMGFLEEPKKSAKALRAFADSISGKTGDQR